LVDRGREVGVDLRRTTSIVDVQPSDDRYQVALEYAGAQKTIETDLVVHGAGRVAELADLGRDRRRRMGRARPPGRRPPAEHDEPGRLSP